MLPRMALSQAPFSPSMASNAVAPSTRSIAPAVASNARFISSSCSVNSTSLSRSRAPAVASNAPIKAQFISSRSASTAMGASSYVITRSPMMCGSTYGLMTSSRAPVSHAWSFVDRRAAGSKSRTGRLEHMRFGPTRRKGRYYYRFHKQIGKGNWKKYIERYIAPPKIENLQRFIFTPYASYQQSRESHSWFWRLPKAIATSTSSDELLDAWVQFRHKHPKKVFHYMNALRRLVNLGGCDPGDWRFRLIVRRLERSSKRIINLPKLAYYYGKLHSTQDVEKLSRFIYVMLPRYDVGQLVFIARAHGMVRLSDKYMFEQIAERINLAEASISQLAHLSEAYTNCEISHYTLLNRISAEVQTRSTTTLLPLRPLATIASAFGKCKLQDWAFLELCSSTVRSSIAEGAPIDPADLARLCKAFRSLKCNDVEFFEEILGHVKEYGFDYPPDVLCEIGNCAVNVLQHEAPENIAAFKRIFDIVGAEMHLLSLEGTTALACLAHRARHDRKAADNVVDLVRARISHKLPQDVQINDGAEKFDIASLLHVLSRRSIDDAVLSKLSRHIHRQLQHFEAVDFMRTTRALSSPLTKTSTNHLDARVVKALKKWALKRRKEFSDKDYEYLTKYYQALEA